MQVMPAGMHPGLVNRIGQTGLLGKGKCVHITSQENHRAVAAAGRPLQYCNNS